MRRLPLLLLAGITFASCASSKNKTNIAEPGIGLEQIVGPAQLGYPYGQIEIEYELTVQNNASQPITLIRVTVQSLSSAGGAYTLRRDFYNVRQTIPPKSVGVVTFWAKAIAWGRGIRETEPVTVRGIAYFESSNGIFQKIFIRELSQYSH